MISSLEAACQIWFNSETTCIDDVHIADAGNPEKLCAFKEALEMLSEDAKLFTEVIIGLPDEMCTSLGMPLKGALHSWMKVHYHWNTKRILKAQNEIAALLR